MKKFLTVLLVIAVMFTFSFGSAFAADAVASTTTNQQKLDADYAAEKANLLAVKNAVVEKLADKYAETVNCGKVNHGHDATNAVSMTIAKSVYAQVAEKIYADYMDVLAIQYNLDTTAKTDAITLDHALEQTYAELAGKAVGDVDTEVEFRTLLLNSNGAYLADVLKAEFANYKAEVMAELSKIDVTLYADKVMDADDPYKTTYRQLAEKTKADWLEDAGDVTLAADATLFEAVEALCELNQMIKADKITGKVTYTNANNQTVVVTYRFADNAVVGYDNTALVISDNLEGTDAAKDAVKASKKAQIAAHAAYYYNWFVANVGTATDDAKATVAAAKKLADAYVEVMTERIDNDSTTAVSNNPDGNINGKEYGNDWNAIKAKYETAVKEADTYKVMVDATGRLMYKASVIDENLADAKEEIYDGDDNYSYNLTKDAANVEEDVEWAKKVAIAALEDEMDGKLYQADGTANYYDVEAAKIEAKYAKVIAKIEAATTVAQVNEINKQVDTSTIKAKGAVVTYIQGLSKFDTEYAKLQNYVNYLNGETKEWQDGYKAMMSETALAKFYAAQGARTNAEIVALVDAAKAKVEAIPTKAEAAAAKKAVEEQIAALPAYITLAEKEAVKAAWTAADDLGATYDNQAKLDNAVEQLKNAEKYAITKAFKALPAVAKITTADKAAVAELAEMVKAYEKETMYKADGEFADYTDYEINDYKAAVRDAAKAEVIAAIAAIDADNEASVEAARAAYDEFVAEYTKYCPAYKASAQFVNIDKLLYAEAQIAAAKIEAVEALKITASSKATKGAITVKWTVKGDTDAVEGYEIWKSTKKNSGFKKAFTATKMSYKNTKGLKKGTKYFYKVRAIAYVGAEKVTSDWSNKAYRVAK